jgi:uncharacterized membrane protein
MVHITSAIVWIGASFIFIVSILPSLMQIPNDRMITRTTIRILSRYLKFVLFFSLLLLISGLFMVFATDMALRSPTIDIIIDSKIYIWIFMSALYLYAFLKTKAARNICFYGDTLRAIAILKTTINYVFILNIILGLVAIFFGILLRDF